MVHLHTADLEVAATATKTPSGRERPNAPTVLVAGLACTFHRRGGELEPGEAGVETPGSWQGFVPDGTAVREGLYLRPLSGPGPLPTRFRIVKVLPWGTGWDVELSLEEVEETTPAAMP